MIGRIIFVNVAITIVLILFLELFARVFQISGLMGIDSSVVEYENDYSLFKLKKNSEGKIFGKKIFVDNNGFRVPEKSFKYIVNKPAIFFIGDSITFGNGVVEEETFVGKLRSELNNFNIYNAAVPGYDIHQYLKSISVIKDFNNIKKIFYIFTLNDIAKSQDRSVQMVDFVRKLKERSLRGKGFIYYTNVFFRNKSYLYMYVKGITTDPSKRYFDYMHLTYKKETEFVLTKKYLMKLYEVTKKKNIELKVIILPYEYQTRKNNCFGDKIVPQAKISNIVSSLKIKYKDYTKLFCNNKNPKTLFYKFDPMHLSKKGHDLVFSKILEEL